MELVVLIVAVLAHLGIGLFTFFYNPRSWTNRFFVLFATISAIWGVVNYLSLHQTTPEATLNVIRWVMFFASLHALSLFLLITTFPSPKITLKPIFLTLALVVSSVVLILTQTPLIFASINGSGSNASPVPGPGISLFALTAGFYILGSIWTLISRFRKAKGILRAQFQYLIIGVVGSASLIFVTNFLLVVLFHITSLLVLGSSYTLIFIAATAYAIVAHQLFDIRVIIRRTLVYSALLAFTLGVYSLVIFFFSALFGGQNAFDAKSFIPNLIAAVLIAFGFEPLRRYLTNVTDKYLFKGEYDSQAVLSELTNQLSASVDIKQATQSLVTLIKSQLRLSHAAVITFVTEEGQVHVKEATQDGYGDPSILQLPANSFLLQQFAHAPQVMITDMLRREIEKSGPAATTLQHIVAELEQLQVSLALPIMVDKQAIGIFLVGDKLSGDIFMRDEIQFLTIVANQTANAIEKSRFWEEDQMKSEFVSIASHELLTPTAAMKGYLSMILDDHMGQVDDTARGFLEKVSSSTNRLATLVEDLLNVSRIEGGRLKVTKKPFSLAESVQKAVDELQVKAKEKSLDLAFVAPQGALPNVYADPDHVYRVLVNLIGNSVKYTPHGWIRCFVAPSGPHCQAFMVQDSGLGIPADAIPHLFEKFNRAERREIAGIQGTGLGLYISKRIVELMGGQMWLTSEVGKGTTFYFTLPTEQGESSTKKGE